jgi:hypothetical protein
MNVMKVLKVLSLILLLSQTMNGQCPFDPTISGDLILCPNGAATLSTQTYDNYQWYKRGFQEPDLSIIPGDTSQTISIGSPDDVLYYFAVEATLNGCTEISPEVLVDGLVFLPVTVISTGDFITGSNGGSEVCIGDTMYFTLGLPYNKNITWYKDGSPIPGETSTVLTVTTAGSYTVTGAPDTCPDYLQPLGLNLDVSFVECTTNTDETLKGEDDILIYPNPATDQISIQHKGEEILDVNFFNNLGQLIHQETISANKKTINVSKFDKGLYFIEINKGTRKILRKLLIN